jgi:bacillopeptidase F (M6 metalloprotease family)
MAANLVITKLSAKNSNGVTRVGEWVWGARNKNLEAVDVYQILRDIRNALGIQDGQKVTKTTATNVGYDRSVIKRIADALGIK